MDLFLGCCFDLAAQPLEIARINLDVCQRHSIAWIQLNRLL